MIWQQLMYRILQPCRIRNPLKESQPIKRGMHIQGNRFPDWPAIGAVYMQEHTRCEEHRACKHACFNAFAEMTSGDLTAQPCHAMIMSSLCPLATLLTVAVRG